MDYIAIFLASHAGGGKLLMAITSNWPLSDESSRVVAPVVIRQQLQQHKLSRDCYPLAVGYYDRAEGHKMRRKHHNNNLLIYCFAGRGFLQTPDWEGTVNGGELMMLPQGVPHHFGADQGNPWSIYWCHFAGHLAHDYIDHMDFQSSRPIRAIGESPALKAQFQALLAETSFGFNEPALIYAANMLKQLLTFVGKLVREVNADRSPLQGQRFNPDKVQAYMLQNLDRPIDLDSLAKLSNLSKFHFSKLYRETTGFSPIQHLIQMKVEYARYLLETSDLSIQDIADRLGYDDSLYFSRLFRKTTGVSPRQYREGVSD